MTSCQISAKTALGAALVLTSSIFFCPSGRAQTLRQEAERIGFLVGAAVQPGYLDQAAYATTLAREYNMMEAEDALKWMALRPNETSFDFSGGDKLAGFAYEHGMKLRGHNLVWGIHNPKWLEQGQFTPQQLNALLHQHIAKVMQHYRGKVFAWDVVNEALDENGKLRDSIWYNQPGIGLAGKGTAYIEQAFRWAREADPRALLFYNDGGAEVVNRKSDAIAAMIKDFRRRRVPIDGVGLQMHLDLAADTHAIAANLERLGKLGVQIHITEMDVAVPLGPDGNVLHPDDLWHQAQIYRQVAKACLRVPRCTALQTWGFTDKYSWIGWATNHQKGTALPFDRQYRPKAAFQALFQTLATARR